jgi:hypothetical protein
MIEEKIVDLLAAELEGEGWEDSTAEATVIETRRGE